MISKQRYIFLCAIMLVAYSVLQAQSTPEAFLSQLPSPPTGNCTADRAEIDRFSDRINKVQEQIRQVIDRIHADAQADMEKNKSKIMSKAIQQSGLSKSDVHNLQQSDGSEEEGRKAAEKVVSEQYGISLQELEKVGEMSDAEQEKWAQQYAEQMKNQAMKNPQAAIKKGDKAKRLFELANEQKLLGERITERMNRIAQLFKQVELQDSIESEKLEKKLQPLRKQLCSGICSDAEIARSNAAEKQIYVAQIEYCQKMSPLQTDAIEQYLTTLKSLLPDYRKLTNIQNEIATLQQIGEVVPTDLSCYSAIDDYADVLLSAYKYWFGKFNK